VRTKRVSVQLAKVALPPGQQQTIVLYADMRAIAASGKLRDTVVFHDGVSALLTVEARARVSRWRTFWNQCAKRIIIAVALAVALIWMLRPLIWSYSKATHYRAGMAAMVHEDWAAAHAEFTFAKGYSSVPPLIRLALCDQLVVLLLGDERPTLDLAI
jgi:hypothetical protein